MSTRRLPVYLLLDCSGSMMGEPIEAVRQGVKALLADLKSDPTALETAYLSVITFDSAARQLSPLTELLAFQEPTLSAGGGAVLGAALDLLDQRVSAEVVKGTDTQKGDFKPLVFLLSGGLPTDRWQGAAVRIKNNPHLGRVIALAAGAGADTNVLKSVTDFVLKLDNLQPDTLGAFFTWSEPEPNRVRERTECPADEPHTYGALRN
jgi:uncharacterized protein YegL